MDISQFDYNLPERLIAQTPIENRADSRLMLVGRKSGKLEHKKFSDVLDILKPNDCLVINNTKVIPARLIGEKQDTGGKIELLLLSQRPQTLRNTGEDCVSQSVSEWETLVKPGKNGKVGDRLTFGGGLLTAEIIAVQEDGNRVARFAYDGIFEEVLDQLGEMPLPPYITEKLEDQSRYQTVYAKEPGSAAAPTAGLHFTEELLQKIRDKGIKIAQITLHVGLGTFRPVKENDITDHHMHSEYYEIPAEAADMINETKRNGGRVIAVGTTSCRTLESGVGEDGFVKQCASWTGIYIYPGYEFKAIDGLITNFHLPKSTLIMLVSAFCGLENTLNAYNTAVEMEYRFFSFGDAMLLI